MKKEINIAAILKDKPNIRIYDLLHNIYVKLNNISTTDGETTIWCTKEYRGKTSYFGYSEFGTERGWLEGLQILKPSKEIQDWEKLLWKKGDILTNKENDYRIVFDHFENDEYTLFCGKYAYDEDDAEWYVSVGSVKTEKFYKTNDDVVKSHLRNIEEHYGGKLNISTLQIEQPKPEFKDGDIVFMKGIKEKLCANCIFILRGKYVGGERAFYYAFYNVDDNFVYTKQGETRVHYSLRPATDSEKQQLFDKLEKVGKRWNAETKQIEDVKEELEFKPFDCVLVRDEPYDCWQANLFSHIKHNMEYPFACVCEAWRYCIPYNDSTKHLLGTTDEWEGSN